MNKLAEQAARKIAMRIGEPDIRPTTDHLMYYLPEASKIEFARFIEVIGPLVAKEYAPVIDVLREALQHSYIVGIDNPEGGRILVCNSCFVETTFAYNEPFNVKDMHHADDCWVSRAQKLLEDR